MVFNKLKRIIEVRGCFWHQHKNCLDAHIPKSRAQYWGPKLRRNVERDAENLRKLRLLGFNILVVWECEAKSGLALADKLKHFLDR